MVWLRAWLSVCGLGLALTGCGSDRPAPPAQPTATEGAGDTVSAATSPAPTAEFIGAAASGGAYEIESSKLAQQHATDPRVKAFAAMMIGDHSRAGDALKAAAAGLRPAIAVPPALSAEHQALLQQLQSTTANFDKAYIDQQTLAHEKALALLRGYLAGGDRQPIRDWARTSLPVVQGHLDKVRELAGLL